MLFKSEYRESVLESENGDQIKIGIADTWVKRFKGFKEKGLSDAVDGVLIYPCSSIHTMGMKFYIDVYFLDEKQRIMHGHFNVGPRRCIFCPGAKYVLELKSGGIVFPFADVGEYVSIK